MSYFDELPMSDKEQVLKLYPNAKCVRDCSPSNKMPRWWILVSDNNMPLTVTYINEDAAWQWALAIINKDIMDKLKGI